MPEKMVTVQVQQRAMTLIRRALDGLDGDWQHSQAVENAIFKAYPGDRRQYARKVRQLVFNLKQNGDLRAQLVQGDLGADQLVQMSPHELNPSIRAAHFAKNEERERFLQWIRDVFFQPEPGQQTAMFRCRKCRSTKVDYYQLQTRSADEGMTTFFTCGDCGKRWRGGS